MSAVLLPIAVDGAALPIITLAEVLILVVADPFLFNGAVVVAVFFHGIVALIAHGCPPSVRLKAGALAVIADAAVEHPACSAAAAAGCAANKAFAEAAAFFEISAHR